MFGVLLFRERAAWGETPLAPPFARRTSPEFDTPGCFGVAAGCTTEDFSTHKTEIREVGYRWHPWQGRRVAVRAIRTRRGAKVLFCLVDDDRGFPVLEIPEWLFDAVVYDRLERAEAARVDIGALCGLRGLPDSIKPAAKEVVLEDQHHSKVQGGADAKKIEVEAVLSRFSWKWTFLPLR